MFKHRGDPRGPWDMQVLKANWSKASMMMADDIDGDGRLDVVACAELAATSCAGGATSARSSGLPYEATKRPTLEYRNRRQANNFTLLDQICRIEDNVESYGAVTCLSEIRTSITSRLVVINIVAASNAHSPVSCHGRPS